MVKLACPVNHGLSMRKGTFSSPSTLKCSKQFISTFKRICTTGATSDSTRKSMVLLYLFCLVTLSGSQSSTSPNRYMIGLMGPGSIWTKSISSLYRGCGARYSLCKAVPPRNANCDARNSSLNILTSALQIIMSCSTMYGSTHGAFSFHCCM